LSRFLGEGLPIGRLVYTLAVNLMIPGKYGDQRSCQ